MSAYIPKVGRSAEEIFVKGLDFRDHCRQIDDKIACMDSVADAEYIATLKGTKIAFMMTARALEWVLGEEPDPAETA